MESTPDPARQPQAPANLEALLGGRGLQIAGLLSLFASAAFFFKLAVDHGWLDPLVRVLIGAAAGLAFLVLGITHSRATAGRRAVAEGFVALGAALLFLALWAAGPLFALVPNWAALAGMGLVTGVLTFFAIRMRSELTAIYGLIGGLLAPALTPLGDERFSSPPISLRCARGCCVPRIAAVSASSRRSRWPACCGIRRTSS